MEFLLDLVDRFPLIEATGDNETQMDLCDAVVAGAGGGATAGPFSLGLLQMTGEIHEQRVRLEGGSDGSPW